MRQPEFDAAFAALTQLVSTDRTLAAFSAFDGAAALIPQQFNPIPAVEMVRNLAGAVQGAGAALTRAIAAIAPLAHWQQTYTEAEVGRDFLNRYGWFELVGPGGHFRSSQTRAYIAYWGEGLYYPWHLHEAEELYYVLAGNALFEAEGGEPVQLEANQTRYHAANQPHAMTTGDSPVLTLVLWRGAGIEGVPRMGRA